MHLLRHSFTFLFIVCVCVSLNQVFSSSFFFFFFLWSAVCRFCGLFLRLWRKWLHLGFVVCGCLIAFQSYHCHSNSKLDTGREVGEASNCSDDVAVLGWPDYCLHVCVCVCVPFYTCFSFSSCFSFNPWPFSFGGGVVEEVRFLVCGLLAFILI